MSSPSRGVGVSVRRLQDPVPLPREALPGPGRGKEVLGEANERRLEETGARGVDMVNGEGKQYPWRAEPTAGGAGA